MIRLIWSVFHNHVSSQYTNQKQKRFEDSEVTLSVYSHVYLDVRLKVVTSNHNNFFLKVSGRAAKIPLQKKPVAETAWFIVGKPGEKLYKGHTTPS